MGLFSPRYRCRLCGTRMKEHPHDPVYYCPRCGHRSDERVTDVVHHIRDEPRSPPSRRYRYQQDDRISPMYYGKAKKFSEHKWDPVDNRGYLGKKKKRK